MSQDLGAYYREVGIKFPSKDWQPGRQKRAGESAHFA